MPQAYRGVALKCQQVAELRTTQGRVTGTKFKLDLALDGTGVPCLLTLD